MDYTSNFVLDLTAIFKLPVKLSRNQPGHNFDSAGVTVSTTSRVKASRRFQIYHKSHYKIHNYSNVRPVIDTVGRSDGKVKSEVTGYAYPTTIPHAPIYHHRHGFARVFARI